MTVGIKIRGITTEIGPGGVLHSLFSTISYHLEPHGWGTNYPTLMNKLYNGCLDQEDADNALQEIREIRERLKKYNPRQVIWDIEDPTAPPPWGLDFGPHVTDLANYFVTSTGRDLIGALMENLECLKDIGGALEIISYEGLPIGDQVRWVDK